MADIEHMFRSELAVVADNDLWALDIPFEPAAPFDDDADWDDLAAVIERYPPHGDALGLFPAPNRRLGGTTPDPIVTQSTVHLSDVSPITSPIPIPIPVLPNIEIPLSASSSSSSAPFTLSPTDSLGVHSSEEIDSDDLELLYQSDSEFVPSPTSVDPASLSAPSTAYANANADVLTDTPAIRPSRRASRTMSKVPVPIPNLTKKSRGRKVPTSNGEPIYASSMDKTKKGVRTYTCHAEDCGKCFVRGEHLKRHIRSIHTDEKRELGFRRRFIFYASIASLDGSPHLLKHGRARTRIASAHLAGGTT